MRIDTEPNKDSPKKLTRPKDSFSNQNPSDDISQSLRKYAKNQKFESIFNTKNTQNRCKNKLANEKPEYSKLVEKSLQHENIFIRNLDKKFQNQINANFAQSVKNTVKKAPNVEQINKRMEKYLTEMELRKKQKKVESEFRQFSECTFSPSTNSKGKNNNRAIMDFYNDQINYYNKSKEKIKEIQEEKQQKEAQEITLSPKICKTSRKMFHEISATQNSLSVYQRLNSHSKEKQRREKIYREIGNTFDNSEISLSNSGAFPYRSKTPMRSEAFKFQPVILKKSSEMQREKKVGNLLYEKAMKKLEKQENRRQEIANLIDQNAKTRHITRKSNTFVCDKFDALFETCWKQVSPNNENLQNSDSLSDFLVLMGFVKDHEAEKKFVENIWEILNTSRTEEIGVIRKQGIYQFLQKLIGNKSQDSKIHYKFWQLYQNYINTHTVHARSTSTLEPPSFSPRICRLSEKIVTRSRSQFSINSRHCDSLILKGEQYEEKRRTKLLERSYTITNLCTFHPNLEKSRKSRSSSQFSRCGTLTLKDALGSNISGNHTENDGLSFATPRTTRYFYYMK